MDAVAFDTVIHDGKIDVPQQYLPLYPAGVRVILIKEQDTVNQEAAEQTSHHTSYKHSFTR